MTDRDQPGVGSGRVVLLTRAGCTACAAAADVLDAVPGLRWQAVDVDLAAAGGDRETRMEYGDRLPVILLDGREHSYGEVDEVRLLRDLGR